jgi:hypothetical protein
MVGKEEENFAENFIWTLSRRAVQERSDA